MKALVLEEYMKLVYRDVPDPSPAEDEVLVKVRSVGICGSDIHGMDGSSGRRIPPLIMGHEAAGEIASLGKKVSGWSEGDRVTFDSTVYRQDDWYTRRGMYNLSDGRRVLGVSTPVFRLDGAYAEYVAVPGHILYRIPDGVGFTKAAMCEPVAVALHAINLTEYSTEDTALVVGAGMIGLYLIQLLKIKGIRKIIAVDTDPGRRKMALDLGADQATGPSESFDAARELSSGRGADIAFEVVGSQDALNTCIRGVRRGASITLVGNLAPKAEIPFQDVVTGQLRLQGSCAINGEFSEVLQLMSGAELDTETLLSAEAPLSEGAEWFARLYNKEKGLIKVVLLP